MKIEIRQQKPEGISLYVDGRKFGSEGTVYISDQGGGLSVSIFNSRLSKKLLLCSTTDLPDRIASLQVRYPIGPLVSDFEFRRAADEWDVWVALGFDGENWKNRWSITEYCDATIDLADSEGKETAYDEEFYGNKFEVFVMSSGDGTLASMVERAVKEWHAFHTRVISQLENAVVVEFEFPPEIRVPCEQYLQYFGQFLRDLGVNSNTTVRHDGDRTILSSSPSDKRDALEKIRRALDIYLKLSASAPDAQQDSPLPAHQLIANIHHLQGQLSLAHATLEAKNATILAQASSLRDVQALVAASLVTNPKQEKAVEPLLGGIVTLGSSDPKYGFSVSWAELFRRLRAYFRTKD